MVGEVRERVRERHKKTAPDIVDFELPDLSPLGHARDLADGKTAAIGTVNPRPPGLANNLIQATKRAVARALGWFVRDQIEFNRAVVAYMDRDYEAMIEHSHNLRRVALELSEFRRHSATQFEALSALDGRVGELSQSHSDLLAAWTQWRPTYEDKVEKAEIHVLHSIRQLEAEARTREQTFRAEWRKLHDDYVAVLESASKEIHDRFWGELEKLKTDQERQIHTELRVLRRKTAAASSAPADAAPSPSSPATSPQPAPSSSAGFDYTRFEERFRGDEDYVAKNQEFYLPYLADAKRVLDLGCGRGELLKLLADRGAETQGVDLDPEALEAAREKGLDVVQGDLFEFLAAQPDESYDGVVCAHVVEHVPPLDLARLTDLIHAKLRPGGVCAIETPNPRCLAIFAGDFYLDPTHQRPVPSALLDFLLRESGFGQVETVERHPASEVYPELAKMDDNEQLQGFRQRFFGGLDYAIIARKL